MKVLFVMRHAGYVRNFESTLRRLCERGHEVHLAFQGDVKYAQLDPIGIATQLASAYPGLTYGDIPMRRDNWGLLGRELRLGLDYLRYRGDEYARAPKLRARAERKAPPWVMEQATTGRAATPFGRRVLSARLRAMNRAIPTDPALDAVLRERKPDVLAVTPLIEPGAPQAEYLRSARALGIRTMYCAASWDNLTNKGLVHGPVDVVAVWNEEMKREAVTMHGVRASRVAVTGAAAFDHWFEWTPATTREAFAAQVGLPDARPFVLYLCSSKFVAPDEVPFVRQWLARLRASRGPLRDAGVLVRPHPQNAEQWVDVELEGLGPVAVWPRAGAAPVDTASRSDYFDSLHHSAAAVGINTTAEIEAAILGRPVHTVLAPAFRDTQEGTLHFHYLRDVNGGVLNVANDLDEHVVQLEASLREPEAAAVRARRFVEAFVRPYGLDQPATPRLVDAFERLAARPAPSPERAPIWAPVVRRSMRARLDAVMAAAANDPESFAGRLERSTRRSERATHKARIEGERLESREKKRQVRRQRIEHVVEGFRKLSDADRRTAVEAMASAPPRRLDYARAEILMRATTARELDGLTACARQPSAVEWIDSHVRPRDVVYDVGAGTGACALLAARRPRGTARVIGFESRADDVASLCANVALNGLSAEVTPMAVTLGERTALTASGAVWRLDDLRRHLCLPLPNHVRLAVGDGALEIVRGGAETLAWPGLRSVFVQASADAADALTAVLGASSLRISATFAGADRADSSVAWSALFERSDAASPQLAVLDRGGVTEVP